MPFLAAVRKGYEPISRVFPFFESLRSEGRAPRPTRSASGDHALAAPRKRQRATCRLFRSNGGLC